MNFNDESIAAFRAVAVEYADELKKAERDLERAKKKVDFARTQLKVANDMIAKATQGDVAEKTLIDRIMEVLAMARDPQSAKSIHTRLSLAGYQGELVSVHTAADRAVERGLIKRTADDGPKLYYREKPTEVSSQP